MELAMSIEDVLLIQKIMYRATTTPITSPISACLKKAAPCPSQPRLQPSENERGLGLVTRLNNLVAAYKEEMLNNLKSFGEHQYMEGDGILRIEPSLTTISCDNINGPCSCGAWHNVEYRVFFNGVCGTEYAGSFNKVNDARGIWSKKHEALGRVKLPEDVDVYSWQKIQKDDGEVVWEVVQFCDLEEDNEIQEWVMNADQREKTNESLNMDEDPGEEEYRNHTKPY